MAEPGDILAFWFGDDPDAVRQDWFEGGPAFDAACRRFRPAWEAARAGDFDDWRRAPSSLLAYVILTDQIPRNLYRKDARAFQTDDQALAAARLAIRHGWDRVMRKQERLFLYLPFEHAEDLATQEESLRLYQDLGEANYVEYAQAHLDLIRRFGRFPHRNVLLGRESTAEEIAFMAEHGRGY